jgi:hypothetical protein
MVNSPFLFRCYRIYKNKFFEKIILTMIVVSSFKLVIDTYFDEAIDESTATASEIGFRFFLDILDYTFNAIFIFELIVKVISLGFVLDYETYLRDSWC